MLKKITIFVFIFCILIINNTLVFADDELDKIEFKEIEKVIQTSGVSSNEPKINSKHAIVLDRKSKAILFGKNDEIKTKMASTTKIMTAIVVIENTNLNDIVEISKKAASTGGSRLKIRKGDKITVKDLLYGLMLRSGNDAGVALAEYVGGNVEKFAVLMNKKAQELGLKKTNFVTPHGLDSEEHYTTAYELAIITDYALKNQVFLNIVKTKNYNIIVNGYPRQISNTNELLGNFEGVYGVKTGFTNGAGRCLVTAVNRKKMDIICVVLGANTKKDRTADSIKLIEYIFKNYKYEEIKSKIDNEFENWKKINQKRINIEKGIKNKIDVKIDEYNLEEYPVKINSKDNIKIQIEAEQNLKAPVNKNSKIGEVLLIKDNNIILKIGILVDKEIRKKNVIDYILEIYKSVAIPKV